MRKNAARILGLLITVLALATPSHKAEAASGACTLLCVQGYHCVVQGDTQTCVPN